MIYLKDFIISFFATLGFCILFNVPKKYIIHSCLTGAIGWCVFIFNKEIFNSNPFPNFLASIVIGILGEIFARINKTPVTLYVIPGIIPLVPGYGIYLSMIHLINNDFYSAIKTGVDTLFIAGAISMGIIIVTSFSRLIKIHKLKIIKKNKRA
ncbi:MAG: threonine/serine exporter family protein [Peptostreptococcaceae bacterium]|jgi:uncharacterized membrane protein YjjB (DUF3815 family)|nr:threonine/serine exporter family protein [Peptostreptococcaceae bacterium]